MEVLVSEEPPAGTVLRVMAVYKKTEHMGIVVRRCPHHETEDSKDTLAGAFVWLWGTTAG